MTERYSHLAENTMREAVKNIENKLQNWVTIWKATGKMVEIVEIEPTFRVFPQVVLNCHY
jgi:hypothetical protein